MNLFTAHSQIIKCSFFIVFFIVLNVFTAGAQSVGISEDGSVPDAGAILDLKSNNKGLLIPRMSTNDRELIDGGAPAEGMLVYDTDTKTFWYFANSTWINLKQVWIEDSDQDTKITVEKTPDIDKIHFEVKGTEVMHHDGKTLHAVAPGGSLFIGQDAGLNDDGIDDGVDNENTFIGVSAGYSNTSGIWNTYVGNSAGAFSALSSGNTMIGYRAGLNTVGIGKNTFIGTGAGTGNTSGEENHFSGYLAGHQNTTSSKNHFAGYQAGYSNSGSSNLFIGYQAGRNNSNSSNNVFIGREAGMNNSSIHGRNIFIGHQAGKANSAGSYNLFIGYQAGLSNTTGQFNNFIGYKAGENNTEGSSNHFLGYYAGFSNTTGEYNYFSGLRAGDSNTTGSKNYFVGYQAGASNTTGSRNYFSGYQAGKESTSQNENHFVGYQAGYSNVTGVGGHFTGYKAGYSNTSGLANHFFGHLSGTSNTSGHNNTFLGYLSGTSNETGNRNTYLGLAAGNDNVIGSNNVAIGHQAGYSNTDSDNVFIGKYAGYNLDDGISNTMIGTDAGWTFFGTGNLNTFVGRSSGLNASGSGNTLIGAYAGENVTEGNNVIIGVNAAKALTTSTGNVIIGNDTSPSENTTFSTNNVIIGQDAYANNGIENSIAIGYNTGVHQDNSVVIGRLVDRVGFGMNATNGEAMGFSFSFAYLSTGGDWVNASDRNLKENVTPIDSKEILNKVSQLPITQWNYIADGAEVKHIGPMAQDFYALFKTGAKENTISTIDPAGVALAAIQELHKTQQELLNRTKELEALQNTTATLLTELNSIQKRLGELENKGTSTLPSLNQ